MKVKAGAGEKPKAGSSFNKYFYGTSNRFEEKNRERFRVCAECGRSLPLKCFKEYHPVIHRYYMKYEERCMLIWKKPPSEGSVSKRKFMTWKRYYTSCRSCRDKGKQHTVD